MSKSSTRADQTPRSTHDEGAAKDDTDTEAVFMHTSSLEGHRPLSKTASENGSVQGHRSLSKTAPENEAGTAQRFFSKESSLRGLRGRVRRAATTHITGAETFSNPATKHEVAVLDGSGDLSLDAGTLPRPQTDIVELSKELSIPLDIVREAADFFRAQLPSTQAKLHDPLADGWLTRAFLQDLYGDPFKKEDEKVSVGFRQFALLFYCHGFSEGLTLTQDQRNLRQTARKHNIPITDLDEYKQVFDQFDEDGNNEIDAEEFEKMLYRLSKVGEGQVLPPNRTAQLWHEADIDNNGSISFEEFMCFYHKYFKSQGTCAFSSFYSPIRTVNKGAKR